MPSTSPDPDCQRLCDEYPDAVATIAEVAGVSFADLWAGKGPDPDDPVFVTQVWQRHRERACPVCAQLRREYPTLAALMESVAGASLEVLLNTDSPAADDPAFVRMVERVAEAVLTPKGWLREDVLAQCGLVQFSKPATKLRKRIKALANAVQRPAAT